MERKHLEQNYQAFGSQMTGWMLYAGGMFYQQMTPGINRDTIINCWNTERNDIVQTPGLLKDIKTFVVLDCNAPDDTGNTGANFALRNESGHTTKLVKIVGEIPDKTTKKQIETLKQKKLELVLLIVRNKDDLFHLIPTTVEQPGQFNPGLRTRKPDPSTTQQANGKIHQLIQDLQACDPEYRRQFLELISSIMSEDLTTLEYLWPLNPDNPFLAALNKPA